MPKLNNDAIMRFAFARAPQVPINVSALSEARFQTKLPVGTSLPS